MIRRFGSVGFRILLYGIIDKLNILDDDAVHRLAIVRINRAAATESLIIFKDAVLDREIDVFRIDCAAVKFLRRLRVRSLRRLSVRELHADNLHAACEGIDPEDARHIAAADRDPGRSLADRLVRRVIACRRIIRRVVVERRRVDRDRLIDDDLAFEREDKLANWLLASERRRVKDDRVAIARVFDRVAQRTDPVWGKRRHGNRLGLIALKLVGAEVDATEHDALGAVQVRRRPDGRPALIESL